MAKVKKSISPKKSSPKKRSNNSPNRQASAKKHSPAAAGSASAAGQGNIDLKNARDFADTIIATIREALIVLNSNLRIELANRAFYDLFKLNTDQTEGQLLYEIADRELN